jgi:hypothetical protein
MKMIDYRARKIDKKKELSYKWTHLAGAYQSRMYETAD